MCNLYSLTKGQAAIRDWFRTRHDRTGNLPPFPGIFPDQMAPIVRTGANGERELVMARWGMPGPPQYGSAPSRTPATCTMTLLWLVKACRSCCLRRRDASSGRALGVIEARQREPKDDWERNDRVVAFAAQAKVHADFKSVKDFNPGLLDDGQLAIAKLEDSVLAASAQAKNATIDDLGSAAFMVDLAYMGHETQYTRLFRS
jgi:hypothetical protein